MVGIEFVINGTVRSFSHKSGSAGKRHRLLRVGGNAATLNVPDGQETRRTVFQTVTNRRFEKPSYVTLAHETVI